MIKRIFKTAVLSIGIFISTVILYLINSIVFSIISLNKAESSDTGIVIYVKSNGLFTDSHYASE